MNSRSMGMEAGESQVQGHYMVSSRPIWPTGDYLKKKKSNLKIKNKARQGGAYLSSQLLRQQKLIDQEFKAKGWKDGSAVKTGCSSRGLRSSSQHPHSGSQLHKTPVQKSPFLASTSTTYTHMHACMCTYICSNT